MEIKDLMRAMMEKAKYNLKNNENFVPVAVFLKDGAPCGIAPLLNDEQSTIHQMAFAVGMTCKKNNFDGSLLVFDAAMRMVSEEDRDYVLNNLDTENPLTYPEGLIRQECLTIIHCPSEGDPQVIAQIYEKKDGKVLFKDFKDETSVRGGIQASFYKGYEYAS